jgi:hypothetical protein
LAAIVPWIAPAEFHEAYNSNIFATTTSRTRDFITALAPGFDLVSNFPRNALNLHGSGYLIRPKPSHCGRDASLTGRPSPRPKLVTAG